MINFTENDHLVYSFISRQCYDDFILFWIFWCYAYIVIKHWNINQELNHPPCKCCIFFLPTAVSIGTSVLQVKANDTDSTKSLQYSIDRLSIIAKSSDGTQITTFYPYDYRVSPCWYCKYCLMWHLWNLFHRVIWCWFSSPFHHFLCFFWHCATVIQWSDNSYKYFSLFFLVLLGGFWDRAYLWCDKGQESAEAW